MTPATFTGLVTLIGSSLLDGNVDLSDPQKPLARFRAAFPNANVQSFARGGQGITYRSAPDQPNAQDQLCMLTQRLRRPTGAATHIVVCDPALCFNEFGSAWTWVETVRRYETLVMAPLIASGAIPVFWQMTSHYNVTGLAGLRAELGPALARHRASFVEVDLISVLGTDPVNYVETGTPPDVPPGPHWSAVGVQDVVDTIVQATARALP